jgi:serine/threonine protein phosphatase Stp1
MTFASEGEPTQPAPAAEHLAPSLLSAGRFRSSAASHPGSVRTRNEDRFVNRPDLGIWAVADGAGGHQAGDVAAALVAAALHRMPVGLGAAQLLAEARLRVSQAHEELRSEAARRGPTAVMATTIVVLLARGDYFACLWAGDSRAYLLRGGELRQVTHDHSYVQELVDAGAISAAEASAHPRANVITRAVGSNIDELDLDKVSDRLRVGDRFLLCSDGITKSVPERDLAELLAIAGDTAAEQLLTVALERKADDNITAVTVDVLPDAEDTKGPWGSAG